MTNHEKYRVQLNSIRQFGVVRRTSELKFIEQQRYKTGRHSRLSSESGMLNEFIEGRSEHDQLEAIAAVSWGEGLAFSNRLSPFNGARFLPIAIRIWEKL
jgi:hypothetical protein